MKRRIFAVILSCLMVLSLIPFAAFAADEHEHNYTETVEVIIEASCTSQGLAIKACECGKSDYVVLPMHELTSSVEKEATCQEPGEEKLTCKNCDYSETKEIPQTKHEYITTYVAATCLSGPRAVSWCKHCEQLEKAEDGSDKLNMELGTPIDHRYVLVSEIEDCTRTDFYGETFAETDCTVAGYEFKICLDCYRLAEEVKAKVEIGGLTNEAVIAEILRQETLENDPETDEDDVLPSYWVAATGHVWGEGKQNSTACEVAGCNGHKHYVFECLNCDQKTSDTATHVGEPDLDHEHENKLSKTVKADCENDGLKTYTCKHCSYKSTEVIKARGHKFSTTLSGKNSTCVSTSNAWYACTNTKATDTHKACTEKDFELEADGETKKVYPINPAKHTGKKTEVELLGATCTAPGLAEEYCKDCGEYLGIKILNVKHTPVGDVETLKDYTCTEGGQIQFICKDCNQLIVEDTKAQHTWEEEVLKEATCTETGLKRIWCSKCGKIEEDTKKLTIATIAHTNSEKGNHLPTCDRNAIVNGTYCLVCGAVTSAASTEVPNTKLAHDYSYEHKPATCFEGEHILMTCKACGFVTKDWPENAAGKLTHTGVKEKKNIDAPTCTEDQVITYTCKTCGTYTVVNEKLGHDFGDYVDVAPTCSAYGYKARFCNNDCGAKTDVTIIENQPPVETAHKAIVSNEKFLVNFDCETGAVGIAFIVCEYCGVETFELDENDEKVYFKAIDPVHTWEKFVDEKPLCHEDNTFTPGSYDYKCTVCGAVADKISDGKGGLKDDTIAAEHDYGTEVVIANTDCGGKTTKKICNACGYISLKTTGGDAKKHTAEKQVFAKTCTQDMCVKEVCTKCYAVLRTEWIADGDSIDGYNGVGHASQKDPTYEDVLDATCTEPAYDVTICSRCDQHIKAEKVEGSVPNGHTAPDKEEWIVIEATCDKVGTEAYICTVCDIEVSRETSGKLLCAVRGDANAPTDRDYTVVPTCQAVGYYYVTCANCDEHVTEDIYLAAKDTNHTNKELFTITSLIPKTCTTKGLDEWACNYCNHVEYHVVNESHEWSEEGERSKPVCDTKVDLIYTCTVCGAKDKETVLEYVDHIWDNGVVTEEATCTEGTILYTCLICDAEEEDTLDPVEDHEFSEDKMILQATCTEPVRIGIACVNCYAPKDGKWDYKGESTVPHNYISEKKEADCLKAERIVRTCQDCGDVAEINVPGGQAALNHPKKTYAYNSKGEHTVTCTVCGDQWKQNCYTVSSTYYPMYNDGAELPTQDVAANCLRPACKTFSCVLCLEKGIEVPGSVGEGTVDANTHAFDKVEVLLDATCATPGIVVKTCSCGKTNESRYEGVAPLTEHEYGERQTFTNLNASTPYSIVYFVCDICKDVKVVASTISGGNANNNFGVTPQLEKCLLGEHNEVVVEAADPNGCVDGHKGYTYCDECELVLTNKEVVAASHNTEVIFEGYNEATGTYYITTKCKDCGKTETKTYTN